MKLRKTHRLALSAAVGAACAMGVASGPAQATNGYFANGYNPQTKGMSGAGVAVETGVLGLAQNPAMGTRIGREAEFCASLFSPDRDYTVGAGGALTPGTSTSKNKLFLVPCAGINYNLDDQSSLGFVMYGNGGMNTEYPFNTFAGLGAGSVPLGVNLEQLFISANYAYDVNESLTVGIAPTFVLQRFAATGLEAFVPLSSNGAAVTNNGDDWSSGFGVNLGLVYQPNEQWTIGAAYRSKMFMDEFGKYAGLFAEQGGFDVPAVATLGAAYTPASNPDWTVTAEYQRIFYSDIASIANSGAVPATPLGADNGPGFGWDDMDVIRLAASYRASPKLTVRGGVSYASDFIEDNEVMFNILAPATIRWHASIGATYQVNERWAVNGSYTRAFNASKSGVNPFFGSPINLRMDQHEVAVGMTYKW